MKMENPKNAFVFLNRKRDIGDVASFLQKQGYEAAPLHGDLPQVKRTETLQAFRDGKVKMLVCSDVAARGLDISAVSHVFNYDVPMSPDDYVHRIGRTGRAGMSGRAWMLASKEDEKFLANVERLIKKPIPVFTMPDAPQEQRAPHEPVQQDAPRPERGPRVTRNNPREEHEPRAAERPRTQKQEERRPRPEQAAKPVSDDLSVEPGFGDDVPAFFRKG